MEEIKGGGPEMGKEPDVFGGCRNRAVEAEMEGTRLFSGGVVLGPSGSNFIPKK